MQGGPRKTPAERATWTLPAIIADRPKAIIATMTTGALAPFLLSRIRPEPAAAPAAVFPKKPT
jgi:hypothetical protein